MDDKLELFRAALGLPEPWRVVRTEFDPAARRLDLYPGLCGRDPFLRAQRVTGQPARSTTRPTRPGATLTSSSTRPTCTPALPG